MRNFNPDDYEPVDARVKRFYGDHPEGSIYTFLMSNPENMDYAVFKAEIHTDGKLRAVGWSQAIRDKELAISKKGTEYETVNYTSWLENAETSAIGRALANFGYQGSKRASREEMQKAGERVQHGEDEGILLTAELEAVLVAAEGRVKADAIAAVRANLKEHPTAYAWIRKMIVATKEEIKRQEALLAANTTSEPAKKSLDAAAEAGWDRAAKQKELTP